MRLTSSYCAPASPACKRCATCRSTTSSTPTTFRPNCAAERAHAVEECARVLKAPLSAVVKGAGFFPRPVVLGWVLWFGWLAEEIKTIVYCYVLSGGTIGDHIKKDVETEIMFDPPPPPGLPTTVATFCPFKVDP